MASKASRRYPTEPPFTAEAMIISDDHDVPSFVDIQVQGEPRVQERTRVNYRVTRIYDPSTHLKAAFSSSVKAAFTELGVDEYPIFLQPEMKVTIVFGVNSMDKDIDNLLKFVFDALQTIVYGNNRVIVKLDAEKRHTPTNGFTSIQVEPHLG